MTDASFLFFPGDEDEGDEDDEVDGTAGKRAAEDDDVSQTNMQIECITLKEFGKATINVMCFNWHWRYLRYIQSIVLDL